MDLTNLMDRRPDSGDPADLSALVSRVERLEVELQQQRMEKVELARRLAELEGEPNPTDRLVSHRTTHRLRYTGNVDEREFQEHCLRQDFWYHSYYFDNGFEQRGDYDIGLDIQEYGFPSDLRGLSVLDVGTGSGWFATYFEQSGADVTTVDVRGYCDFDFFGRPQYPDISTEKSAPDRVLPDGRAVYYSPVSQGFWIMKDILGLRAEYVNSRVYDLSPRLFGGRKFDLVFAGSLLMHVRDPIGALAALHSVCDDRIICNSLRQSENESSAPQMSLVTPFSDVISWWAPNRACFEEWLKGAGFASVDVSGLVHLTADSPYTSKSGGTTGVSQVHYLAHASVR